MNTLNVNEKLDQFAAFIGLLTGALNVRVVSHEQSSPGCVVLPPLDNLDSLSIDVLYGLCLREAGHIAKSHKTVDDIAILETEHQVLAAMLVEGARIERFLCRHFGGGAELLEEHWKVFASNPRFTNLIFNCNPKKANSDVVFLNALKWDLMGRPKWGWEQLFPSDNWALAIKCLDDKKLMNPILSLPLRKFKDAATMGVAALSAWHSFTQTKDMSKVRVKTKKQNAWESALNDVQNKILNKAQKAHDSVEKIKEMAKELREKIAEERAKNAPLADPLRAQIELLDNQSRPYRAVSAQSKVHDRAINQLDRTNKILEKTTLQVNSLQERKNSLLDPTEVREKVEHKVETLTQKEQSIIERKNDQLASIDSKEASIQIKEQDLIEKMQEEGLNEAKIALLEEKINRLAAQLEDISNKRTSINEKFDKYAEAIREKADVERQKGEMREVAQGNRAKNTEERLAEKNALKAALEKAVQDSNAMINKSSNELKKVLKENGLANDDLSLEKVMQNINDLNKKRDAAQKELEEVTKKQRNLSEQARKFNEKASKENSLAQWEVQKEMQKIEKSLNAAGINCSLTEKMEEMEGWGAANNAQAKFDNQASNELRTSVINGCGGGRGNRDVMVDVQNLTNAINEVDPNTIFADVAKLSPMSGWSESGARVGDKNVSTNANNSNENQTALSKLHHTVWSKKYDLVISPPVRSSATISDLRKQYAMEIQKIKKIFASKFRPAFKNKFVGGKEEGDLDSRAIWKLAAKQDSDFYEVIHKRPDHKAAATILIDLSGSCASWGVNDDASKSIQALALMISEGFSAVNIPHEILGFYAPMDERLSNQSIPSNFNRKACRLETVVAKGFRDKDLSGLASLTIQQADNCDGESVRLAVSRLLKQSGKSKMLVIISDGKPFMQDSDALILDDDLRLALLDAAQKKVVVTGLGLAANHPILGDGYTPVSNVNELSNVIKDKFFFN